ncbi:RelA/SpoT family protein, partial [bacterium]|nr:RelA/SpoT family protein [bacterium]
IYAPLAHRFGINRVKWELEDLALKVLDERAYRRIAERISLSRKDREKAVEQIVDPIKKRLEEENIQHKVVGRAKHFYSIYNKIKRRGKSFEEIMDLIAVRVVVETIPDCYRALGIVHNLYTPIAERFSDYIAMPKGNMYQSLHTKVMDNDGRTVEVQIRTREMDLVAEVGIAAHWHYKEEGDDQKSEFGDNLSDYYRWLRQLIEGSKEEDSSTEFMKRLKINLFTDEIYVFTPKGKLIQLPKMSTPIDFAFAVHTDIGMHALGAKVNGRMVPLDAELKNGDTVEILTSNNSRPSIDWLRVVRTGRARNNIRKHFQEARVEDAVRGGRELLERELLSYKRKPTGKDIEELVDAFGARSAEDFFRSLGTGELELRKVVHHLVEDREPDAEHDSPPQMKVRVVDPQVESILKKQGAGGTVTFGRCCDPIPGEPIIGFIHEGKELIVHRTNCHNVSDLVTRHRGQLVEVEWDVSRIDRFHARLRYFAEDRKYLVRDIGEAVAKVDASIHEANLRTEGNLALGTIIVPVRGLSHLNRVLNRLLKVKGVLQVERINVAEVPNNVV